MVELTAETRDAVHKSLTDQLIEEIKDLSNPQQEELLGIIQGWRNDNREYPRKNCKANAIFSDNCALIQGMIMDISAGGLYLKSDRTIEVGKIVTVCFENPFTKEQVKVNGKIVRCDWKGVAIKFDKILH